jgi:hypothetical protein
VTLNEYRRRGGGCVAGSLIHPTKIRFRFLMDSYNVFVYMSRFVFIHININVKTKS